VIERVPTVEMIFFIIVEGRSRTFRGWLSVMVVQIQYLSFDSRGEATG
jgi:hypothetical protein